MFFFKILAGYQSPGWTMMLLISFTFVPGGYGKGSLLVLVKERHDNM
jgi:hypothetical protein